MTRYERTRQKRNEASCEVFADVAHHRGLDESLTRLLELLDDPLGNVQVVDKR